LDSGERGSTAANTLTGVLIAGLFSGLPAILTLSGVWNAQDEIWVLWVCCQWFVYAVGWKYLNDRLCVLPATTK
jgi:hypothetical protein